MPRYNDRHGNSTRLYVGHLSSRTRSRDLEHIFGRYGRVRDVDMKRDYAFVDLSDPRDADDARYSLDGREVDGRRIIVEFAKGVPRGPGGVREYVERGSPPGTGRCFNCGLDGHWARDCKAGDWKNKCYRCGERGHIEKNCQNSPKKLSSRHGRSYSRSPPRRSYSRSYSRSRSPPHRVERSRTRSPSNSLSPEPKKGDHSSSPTPDEGTSREKSPSLERKEEDVYSQSPQDRGKSPVGLTRDGGDESPYGNNEGTPSPGLRGGDESLYENNEGTPSPNPNGDRSPPIDDDGEN